MLLRSVGRCRYGRSIVGRLTSLGTGFLGSWEGSVGGCPGCVGGREEVFVGLGGGDVVPCSSEPNSIDDTAVGALDVGEAMIVDPGRTVGGAGAGGAILKVAFRCNALSSDYNISARFRSAIAPLSKQSTQATATLSRTTPTLCLLY
jgi:hypothetical protein